MARQPIRFGTDGWRAVIADGFTFENVERVTSAIAQYILHQHATTKPVVIGFDTRFLGQQFATRAAEVLKSFGLSVLITDQYTPTPIVAFAAKAYDTAGAMMFTASHNPPEYCGIKYIPEYAGPATPEITNEILEHLAEIDASGEVWGKTPGGRIETFQPRESYETFLKERINFDVLRKHPLRILYDPMHGAGQGYLDEIFHHQAGFSIDCMRNTRDPLFGNIIPEPKDEYLGVLMERVPQEGYDLGIANDGDADRFGIVAENGEYFCANQVIPMLFRHLYKHRGYRGSVVRTVATSMLLDRLAEKYGVTVRVTPVGFKYVGDWMRKEAVIIGGEESGGISILGHIPEKDGILAALLVAEMVALEGKPFSQIYKDVVAEAGVELHNLSFNLHLEDDQKQRLIDDFKALAPGHTFAKLPIQQIDSQDGIKLVFGDNDWLMLRPSGTEPILRVYGETTHPEWINQFQDAVKALLKTPLAAS